MRNLLFIIHEHLKAPLLKNSLYIMATNISSAGFGFIFWVLAARSYSKEDLGIAVALISAMTLIILLSRLGFDQSIIKYFYVEDKSVVFSTSLLVSTLVSLLIGIIFILGVDIWAPELNIVKSIPVIFLLFVASNSATTITGSSFLAFRYARLYFFQNLINGSRIIFLIPLVFLGSLGIFASVGLSLLLTSIFSISLLRRFGISIIRIDKGYLQRVLDFSIANYIVELLITTPYQLLPIMILNVLIAEETAQYYIAFTIASFLLVIPSAFCSSLFVEGCHGENLRLITKRSVLYIYSVIIPAVCLLIIFGDSFLRIFGKSYASNSTLLTYIAISTLFMASCQIYYSVMRIKGNIKNLIIVSSVIFILLLGSSYLLMPIYGINGVGYAWIITYSISNLLIIILEFSEFKFSRIAAIFH
jgi:O-antigen/teichoic acid export membrane protein